MKKVVSFLVSISMAISLCVPVAAENSQMLDVSQMIDFIYSEEKDGIFEYQYKTDKGDFASGSITKEVTIDGTTKLLCREGEKSDLVTITYNGEVYLNGNLIKVTTEVNIIENEISPFAHKVQYLNNPPKGTTAAEYNTLIRTEKKNIEFLQDLLDITESAFITVVVTALGFNPLGSFAASYVLNKVIDIGGTVHPDGIHALSVITYVYQRESGPRVVGYGTVSKLVTEWYAGRNQTYHIEDAQTVVYRSMTG